MENSVLKISEDDTMKQESVDENEAIKPESSELQEEGEDSSSDSNDSRTESEDDDDEEEEEEENGDESFHPGEEAEDLSSEDASTIDQKVLFGHGQQSSSKGATTAAATATSKFPVLKADPEMTLSDYLRQQNRIISARKADAEDDDDSSSLAESDDSSIKILSSGDELQQVKGQMDAGEIPSSSSGKPGVSYDANVRMARVYKELQFSKPGKKLVSSLLTMSPNHQHMSKTPLSEEAFLDDSKVLQALTDYAANRPQRIIKRKVEAELLEVKTEKRSHKHLTYNKDGHLVTSDGESYDLCDCLDKECAGCNYPCTKCTSSKCSYACRIGRKTFIKSIDVLGSGRIYNPFL